MSDVDDKSVPFARRQVQWGRPPQTTFRAGPLPRGTGLMPPVAPAAPQAPKPAPRPALTAPAAPRPASGGVFGGSLVPQRRPAQPGAGPSLLTAPMPTAPQPARAAALVAPPAPSKPVDTTPRPLPQAAAAPVAAPAPEPAAKSLEPKPATAPRPAVVAASRADASPVAPPVASRASTRKGANRTPLYIAAAAVVVIGAPLATWLIARSHSEPTPASPSTTGALAGSPRVDAAPPVPASLKAAPVEAVAVAAGAPAAHASAPPRPRAAQVRPAAASAETLAANTAAPAVVAPPVTAPPVVIIAPEPASTAGPAPTAARPTQNDPDAPVVTKPQPLD